LHHSVKLNNEVHYRES